MTYVDGGIHNNNPVRVLYDEARSVWSISGGQNIACIVTIGTGSPPLPAVGKRADELLRSMVKIATDTENTARDFANHIYSIPEAARPGYFRFNVQKGLETIGLEEWEHSNTVSEATIAYLDGLRENVDSCVNTLLSVTSK
jgi:predicted acylesterase/phospholipase RssA